jgi:hypothetical protein
MEIDVPCDLYVYFVIGRLNIFGNDALFAWELLAVELHI